MVVLLIIFQEVVRCRDFVKVSLGVMCPVPPPPPFSLGFGPITAHAGVGSRRDSVGAAGPWQSVAPRAEVTRHGPIESSPPAKAVLTATCQPRVNCFHRLP